MRASSTTTAVTLKSACAQHRGQPAQHVQVGGRLEVVDRVEQPVEVGALVGEGGLVELDVPLLHRRAAGSPAGRRRRSRPWAGWSAGGRRPRGRGSPAPGRPAASRRRAASRLKVRTSWRVIGVGAGSTRTLHLWQVPWPPQVESIAMPFHDAESKTVTPGRHPDRALGRAAPSSAGLDGERRARPGRCRRAAPARRPAARSGPRGGRRRARSRRRRVIGRRRRAHAVAACLARCAAIQAMPHSSWPSSRSAALTASTICGRAGVHDRAGQPGGHRHRQQGRAEGVPVGHAEGDVGRAAGHVDAEARRGSGASSPGSTSDVAGVGADRHGQRVDDDVGLRRCRTPRWRRG